MLTNSFGKPYVRCSDEVLPVLVDKGVAEWLDVGDPAPDLVGGKSGSLEAKILIADPTVFNHDAYAGAGISRTGVKAVSGH